MVQYEPIQPVSPTEIVLHSLGRKISAGSELSTTDRLIAMTATAQKISDNYGPGPAEMVLQKPELPEQVQGILANYVG